jgi:hypothetical protein
MEKPLATNTYSPKAEKPWMVSVYLHEDAADVITKMCCGYVLGIPKEHRPKQFTDMVYATLDLFEQVADPHKKSVELYTALRMLLPPDQVRPIPERFRQE